MVDLATIPNIDTQWKELGLALGLSKDSLATIAAKSSNLSRCKRSMFAMAVKKGMTWDDIMRGLMNIKRRDVAKSVCTTYGITLNGLSAEVFSKVR